MRTLHITLILSILLLTACIDSRPAVQSTVTSGAPSPTPDGTTSNGLSTAGGSQGDTWIRTFEGSEFGAFFDIVLTEDDELIAVGTTNHRHMAPYSGDALIMALTPDGDLLWERTWGGEGYEQAWAVAVAPEGGYFIFGETDSYGVGNRDFFLLKTDQDGSSEWYQTYGRPYREWPYGMLSLSNGDMLLYGFSANAADGKRAQYAVRVSPDGDIIWEYFGDGAGDELISDALETHEGNLILAVIADEDGAIVELDPDGNVRWTNLHELPGWQFTSQIAPAGDGGYILAGFSMSASPRQADTWLVRCTASGDIVWAKSFGDPAFDDYATSLIRLNDGTYLIGSIANGVLFTHLDADGEILWRRSLVGEAVHGVMALIELEDKGFLAAGLIQITNGRSYDAILLRTDSQGMVNE